MNTCLPATFCVPSCNLRLFFRHKYSLSFRVQTQREQIMYIYKSLNFHAIKNIVPKCTRFVLSRTWYSVLWFSRGKNIPPREREINDFLQGRDFFTTSARELNLSAWHRRGKVLNHIYRVFTNCRSTHKFAVLFYAFISFSRHFLFSSRFTRVSCRTLFSERQNLIHFHYGSKCINQARYSIDN